MSDTASASTSAELGPGIQGFGGFHRCHHVALEPSSVNESLCQPIWDRFTNGFGKRLNAGDAAEMCDDFSKVCNRPIY